MVNPSVAHDGKVLNDEDDLRAHLEMLQQELVRRHSELESLRALPRENKYLREKLSALNDRVDMLAKGWAEPVNGESISLRTRLLAYQRHNRLLQDELKRKEESASELQEKAWRLEEDLLISKRRCSILFERLRAAGVVSGSNGSEGRTTADAPGGAVMMDEDDPSSFISVTQRLFSAEAGQELLRTRLATIQEDYDRRGVVMAAMQRENAALRASVSRLVQHVQLSTTLRVAGGVEAAAAALASPGKGVETQHLGSVDCNQQKLHVYHAQRGGKMTASARADSQDG